MKECKTCGELKEESEFYSKNKTCKACHKSKYYDKKPLLQIRNCTECGKEFKPNNAKQIYCCRKCLDRKKSRKNKRPRKYKKDVNGKYINNKYTRYKKDKCSFCGFIPVNPCQLDVDHIDGNHKNNNPDNLQTLCANCHRLKTFLNKDGIYKER